MTAPIQPHIRPPRVSPLAAFLEGWRRVWQAPAVLVGTWLAWWLSWTLVQVALSMPAALAPAWVPSFQNHWVRLLYAQLEQLSYALAPELSPFFFPGGLTAPFVAALAIQAALWLFLSGGILDRYARGRPVRTAAFFSACGVCFFRFLRLAAIVGSAGSMLWGVQRVFSTSLPVRLAVLVLIAILGLIVDFAKVRAVVEDRHSMIGALAASVRFIRRRLWRVAGLALLNGLAILAVVRIQFQIVSTQGPGWLEPIMFTALLLLGIAVRLAFMGSEVVFFQGELAHAGYTAAPIPEWPDSPAVEAMDNLVKRR